MITIVTWLWNKTGKPVTHNFVNHTYTYEHVNRVYKMVYRHYRKPFRFVCITDNPTGIECETIPLWQDHLHLAGIVPGTFCRVKIFSPEMRELLGPRIISLDLDCVIVDNLQPIFDRKEPFIGWRAVVAKRGPVIYNASIFALNTGTFPKLWTDFKGARSVKEMAAHGFTSNCGTEQAWTSYKLGPKMPVWTSQDGVLSYKYQVKKQNSLPSGARIVFFHGALKPENARHIEWVDKFYPG